MSRYVWMTTKEYGDNGLVSVPRSKATIGPSDSSDVQVERLKSHDNLGEWFRCKDDDGVIVAEGLFIGDSNSEDAFGPLDDYAEAMFGATTIEYERNGKWEVL